MSSVPAGGGTVRLYHTTQTAGLNGTATVGGVWLVCTSSSSLVQLLSGYDDITAKKMLHALETYQETNLTSSLSNINIRNFRKVQNH